MKRSPRWEKWEIANVLLGLLNTRLTWDFPLLFTVYKWFGLEHQKGDIEVVILANNATLLREGFESFCYWASK